MIAKLSEGDLVATESKYHKTCLAEFCNKVRTFASKASIVVAEMERYMRFELKYIQVESDNIPVFYLKELKNVYVQQMKCHGYAVEYEHSMQFKEKILKRISELTEHKRGGDIILLLKDDWKNYFWGMLLTRWWDVFRKGGMYNSKRNSKQARQGEAIK